MAKQIEIPKPTKVPDNWCWIEMGKLTATKSGFPFDSNRFVKESTDKTRPLIRIRDVVRGSTETFTDESCPDEYVITQGEILIGMDGDFNVAKWQSEDALLNQRVCCIKSTSEVYLDDFLFYYLPDPLKKINDATPSVTVKHLSTKTLAITPVPVPPLAEQRRIVSRIEYLFAKLDEAKEKAQSVLDSFETRKAAILHKAFTGELTAKWRAEHGVDLQEWKSTILSDVVSGFKYGTSEKSDYNNVGMPVLRIPNIGDDGVDFSDMKFLSHNAVEEESQIHEGDILIIRSNGSRDLVGKSVLVPRLERKYAYASFLIRIKPSSVVQADFLTLYLNSTNARSQMFKKAKSSAGINNINSKELGAIAIDLPPISEQMEIVRILDSLFDKEEQAKEAAEAVLEKIDLLKKSILARAFRGELGTNDPREESALELIKQHLSERINEEKPKRKRNKKQPEVEFLVKTIMQVLSAGTKVTPEKLKAETGLEIDDFYDQLKALIDNGRVIETRMDGESYLEAKNEDRQPNN